MKAFLKILCLLTLSNLAAFGYPTDTLEKDIQYKKLKGRLCYIETSSGIKIPRVDIEKIEFEEVIRNEKTSSKIVSVLTISNELIVTSEISNIVYCGKNSIFNYEPKTQMISISEKKKTKFMICVFKKKREVHKFEKVDVNDPLKMNKNTMGGCSGGG